MKVLVAGWFSFEGMGATAGDLLSRDLVVEWLREAGAPCEVAVAAPFEGGIDLGRCDAASFTHVVFVCGPFGNGPPITEFLKRFGHCRLFGLNLSMLQSLQEWNPFEFLHERDSDRASHPDLVFIAARASVPVVGSVLVHPQKEYGARGSHSIANAAIERLLARRTVARVAIDTRLDLNATGLRTPVEVESLLARMDVIVTTRLHGLVMAIRNGIPVLAIDPITGGAKILRQAQTIGWPLAFRPEAVDDAALDAAFDHCLTPQAREAALACRQRAGELLADAQHRFEAALLRTRAP